MVVIGFQLVCFRVSNRRELSLTYIVLGCQEIPTVLRLGFGWEGWRVDWDLEFSFKLFVPQIS